MKANPAPTRTRPASANRSCRELATAFLYFAYGSNMSVERLRAADRAPSAEWLGCARAAGHRLAFDKVGRDGSGKADCEHTDAPQDVVHGALFRIAQADRAALDRAEGLGNGYDAFEIGVATGSGLVVALTYRATRKDASLKPFGWYLQHVLTGARQSGLAEGYIAAIEGIATVQDHDLEREARERAIDARR
jgi:hypothetical protein